MTDKSDPAKDAGRSDASAGKRPHATLDLKAKEVPSSAPASAASGSGASAAASAAGPAASAAPSKEAQTSAAGSSAAGKPSTGPGSEAAAKPAAAGAGAAKPSAPPPKPEAGGARAGGGGLFSHLAAGVIGGGLVYAGAAFLAPNWLPVASNSTVSQLSERIAALEAVPKTDSGVSALSAKVAEIDALKQSLAALKSEQEKLASAPAPDEAADSGVRLSKLEEQLAMLAAAADTSNGRIPQLAAVTGKLSDLESALAKQVGDLRNAFPADIEQRLAATASASEAAKAAAARLDREMAQIRTEQARSGQRDEGTKADIDRLSAAVDAVKEEAGRLSSSVAELKSSVDSQLKSVSRPADVTAAINPLTTKLAELEQNVQGVVRSEQSRKENAERIVLSLELSNLKRALDRGQGQGYAAELAQVRNASAGELDLVPLERYAETGVATVAELKTSFRPVMNAVIDADLDPADGSVLDRLVAGAKSVVRVRKVSHDASDSSTEAIVARIETALAENRLGDVVALAKTLPPHAQVPIEDWLSKVQARHAVDEAIAALDSRLKASLAGNAPDPAPAPPASPAAPQN